MGHKIASHGNKCCTAEPGNNEKFSNAVLRHTENGFDHVWYKCTEFNKSGIKIVNKYSADSV